MMRLGMMVKERRRFIFNLARDLALSGAIVSKPNGGSLFGNEAYR